MKLIILVSCILLTVFSFGISGQSIEIGSIFSSSTAKFYQNAPGLHISYAHHFEKRYLFIGISSSFKKNSYSEIAGDLIDGRGYVMKDVDGELFVNSIQVGVARNLINLKESRLSVGGYASLNYFKFNDDRHYFNYEYGVVGSDYFTKVSKIENHKIGLGCYLDFELKNIILENTSLFTRINGEIIQYDGNIKGILFSNPRIINFKIHLGIKINFSNNYYACP